MNKNELGIALRNELDKGYDIPRISRWAYQLFTASDPRDFLPDERELLQRLFSMEDDSQFEYSELELRALSSKLIEEGEKEGSNSVNAHPLKKAEVLNNNWVMCPYCQEAWELSQNSKVIRCPKCNQDLYNPHLF